MSDQTAALRSLLDLAEDPCPEKRGKLLKALTDLYLTHLPTLSPHKRVMFGEVFEVLAYSLPSTARGALARRIARLDQAPENLIQLLARDVIDVSAPVLTLSPLLSDDDLMQILAGCNQSTAHAIAQRKHLSMQIVHQLLYFEGCEAHIIGNDEAQISYADFRHLYDIAIEDFTLQAPLLKRKDLPVDLMQAFLFVADPVHHSDILAKLDELSTDDVDVALAHSDVQITIPSQLDSGLVAQAVRNATNLSSMDALDPIHLVDQLRQGSGIEFTASISHLANLDFAFTHQILTGSDITSLVLLCKALGFQKAIFSTIVLLSDASRKRSPEAVQQAMALYPKISRRSAEHALRFWRHFSTPLEKVVAA